MGERAWERCPASPNRREILREHRAAREPRSNPAAVSLPRRPRRRRATAAAPRVDIGAAAARRGDRDRSRAGRRPHRRDHHRRNRTPPRCLVLPRRRVRAGRRLPSRRPGLPGRLRGRRQGHLRRLPARPRAPLPGRGRRRPGRLPEPSCTTAPRSPTSPSRESPPAAGSPSPPWSTPAITGCPCPPRPSSCHRMPTSPWPGRPCDTKRDGRPADQPRKPFPARVPDYTAGQDPALGLISPIFADLSGLPPLIIQAGTHEVLLDDAIRLARQAATADVAGHPRHHPPGAARLPSLLPDPRRSGRRTRPSRTTPVRAPRQRSTHHRIAKGRPQEMTDSRTNRGRPSGFAGADHPISRSPRTP